MVGGRIRDGVPTTQAASGVPMGSSTLIFARRLPGFCGRRPDLRGAAARPLRYARPRSNVAEVTHVENRRSAAVVVARVPAAHSAPPRRVRRRSRASSAARVPCIDLGTSQFCAGTLLTRVETFDGVPLDVNVTLPPAAMNGPFPLDRRPPRLGHRQVAAAVHRPRRGRLRRAELLGARLSLLVRLAGGAPARPHARDPNVCNDRGWIRLADARYEARDTQYLAGRARRRRPRDPEQGRGDRQLVRRRPVDDPRRAPEPRDAAGRLARAVEEPGRDAMAIAAAAPLIPWSDLAYALAPNGRTLDYRDANPYGLIGGVEKQSWVTALYTLGLATGFYAPAGADPDADITSWRKRASTPGEPYDGDPAAPGHPRRGHDAITRPTTSTTRSRRRRSSSTTRSPTISSRRRGAALLQEDARQVPERRDHAHVRRRLRPPARAASAATRRAPSQRVDELFARHLKGTAGRCRASRPTRRRAAPRPSRARSRRPTGRAPSRRGAAAGGGARRASTRPAATPLNASWPIRRPAAPRRAARRSRPTTPPPRRIASRPRPAPATRSWARRR